MRDLNSDQIRAMFLDYFRQHGHMIEPSASLVPVNDPTLLWINAGVAALKKYFDGTIKPERPRIANAQKAIRTNDIENVGKTARHHTFFEMLGNFSIGDYFKEAAIDFAWEFLTSPDYIGFAKERLYITIHPDDTEAYDIWTKKLGVDPHHILKSEDNFWQIGEGPSGPDTEIYYDRGPQYDPKHLGERAFFEELENDRYIEIWNIVFSQYDAKEGVDRKDFKELPQKNIDTGMGLERLVCMIQGAETNFDTDLFLPIINATASLAKYPYTGEYKMAYRVIADHIRTVTFALSDGAMFANEGRGYVLRRLLRRAVRYGIKLGIEGSFMYKLVGVVANNMKGYYPYLLDKQEYVSRLVKTEEERFHQTLSAGERLLMDVIAANQGRELAGDVVFKLYDTFGFPYELTKEIAEENGLGIDEPGFRQAMEEQRQRARQARQEVESMASQSADLMDFIKESVFLGYDQDKAFGNVIGLFKDGESVDDLTDEGDVIFDQTPFYAESGGQIADSGTISAPGVLAEVTDVKKAPHKQHLHHVKIQQGRIALGDHMELSIAAQRRVRIRANHSAAHLLQAALVATLGDHIAQAGSYVSDEYMRFDFTHYTKVTAEQLRQIETMVNDFIYRRLPVTTEVMDLDQAKQSGATALFDEKYGSRVRVVTMGGVSKELCGGTHVANTIDLGVFKIVSEESIGSGIRRITAVTGPQAYADFLKEEDRLNLISELLKAGSIVNVTSKVEQTLAENKALRDELSQYKDRLLQAEAQSLVDKAVPVKGLNVLLTAVKDADGDNLKKIVDDLKGKINDSVIFLYGTSQDKAVFVAYCSPKAIAAGYKAGDLAREAARICGGGGGGRPDLAQAGAKDTSKLAASVGYIADKLGVSL